MLDLLFNSLWGWWGIGGVVVAGALAVAWFIPPLRGIALAVAGGAAAAVTLYTKGSRDGSRRNEAKWNAAERKMVDKGNAARVDAERRVASGKLSDDEFNRDRGKVRRP